MTRVSVAFICDSNYIIATAGAVASIIYNKNKDTYYDIYIIIAGSTEIEIEKFYEFKGSDTEIHIIRASPEKYDGLQNFNYITSTACLKFDLPDLIPHQDKVLYLDSDVMILKDLKSMFETDIKDYYAGAVRDVPLIDNKLNIKNYFNSGVMLLNLNMMRKHGISQALYNLRMSTNKYDFMDQDCLNILFEKKVKLLPVKYNFFYNYFLQDTKNYTLEYINKCFGTNYSSFHNIKKDSFIIHMAGHYKPWIYFDSVLVDEWDKYFKKTPFNNYKLKRKSMKMKELQIKLGAFILSYKLTYLLYFFLKFWRDYGFIFAMGKVKNRLFNDG